MNRAALAIKYAAWVKQHKAEFFELGKWQRAFIAAGAKYAHRLVSAANQCGKTSTIAWEAKHHMTGEYPDDWEGLRFNHAPLVWCAGVNLPQIAEVFQKALFGERDGDTFDGTGAVPLEKIISVTWSRQNSQTADTVKIKHTRGVCKVLMKAYSSTGADKKKAQSLAGTSKLDLLLIDEQPPQVALGQMVQRTMHGRHVGEDGVEKETGAIAITYTPELGEDDTYKQFSQRPEKHQFFMNVAWDDVEDFILTDEQKRVILSSIPPHEKEMRSKGIPMVGGEVVFPITAESIRVTPFEIPEHWRVILGIDFGIGHPFAVAKVAWDPDEDVMYVVSGWRQRDQRPPAHVMKLKAMGSPDIPTAYPHDGDTREKGSGEALIKAYEEAGLENIMKFRNPDGSLYREPGILDMLNRMETGRFYCFSDVSPFWDELRLYHRKDGQIVDANDDFMSAVRYATRMVKTYGVQPGRKMSEYEALERHYAQLDGLLT